MDNASKPGNQSDKIKVDKRINQKQFIERKFPRDSLLNFSPDPVAIIKDEYYQIINPAFTKLFGYTQQDLNNKLSFFDLVQDCDQEKVRARYESYLKDGKSPCTFQVAFLSKNNGLIPCEISMARLAYNKRPADMVVVRNLTERLKNEDELRKNEEIFRLISENSRWGISIVKNGSVEYANKAMADIFELPLERILVSKLEDFKKAIHHEDISSLEKQLRSADIKDQEGGRTYSFRIRTKSGQVKWLDLLYKPVFYKEEEAGLITVYDNSDRKRIEEEKVELEAQLRQALKLETVGTLAGGMAHDFNNILQAVSGYSQLILFNTDPEDSNYERLKRIENSAYRAAELIKKLLTFSRKIESKKQPINLNQEIKEVQTFLARTIPKMIDIDLRLAKDLMEIDADSIQLEQILVNICLNARDAMPEGGQLVFETANFTLDDETARPQPEMTIGDYVLLSISDTGQGMDGETLNHIFEPFFTTKEAGKGTGLGLAMVYGIVKSHDGFITCQSEVGQGTVFSIYFPTLDQKQAPVRAQPEKNVLLEGSETVLVVDDEESVRMLIEEALSRFGYRVLTVQDGEEAVWLYSQLEDQIDLVILDLNMPGMGGERCLDELLKRNPEANIIVASGYALTEQLNDIVESKTKAFIGKPFDILRLIEAVRKILDEKNLAGETDLL